MIETISSDPKSLAEGESHRKVVKRLERKLDEVASRDLEEEENDKEIHEDLDLVITKVVAGTSTGIGRKRMTRASSKFTPEIAEKKEHEDSPLGFKRSEKRKATPSTSCLSKAAKGKHDVTYPWYWCDYSEQ